jgi:hypothetical protein
MATNNHVIKMAIIPFHCPKCGILVKCGENYAEIEDRKLCINELPARRLLPIKGKKTPEMRQKEDNDTINHLRVQNLKMRIDLETIIENPSGDAAKRIIEKYRRLRNIRNEQYLSTQN